MTYDEFNAYCGSLPATSHVVQWGGAQVWKVGVPGRGKVFAIGGWAKAPGDAGRGDDGSGGGQPAFTFKTSEISYEVLKGQPGLRPAPYLASRGMKWIQHYADPGLSDGELKQYLAESHRIVSLGLTKTAQRDLGLNQPE